MGRAKIVTRAAELVAGGRKAGAPIPRDSATRWHEDDKIC